jgi:uncharacterized repeat protein (TIGR01451 family)
MRLMKMWKWIPILWGLLISLFVLVERAETRLDSLNQSIVHGVDGPAQPDGTRQSSSWQMVGQVGGPTEDVAVQGNYAYVGVGLRLVVLDVSDPTTPEEIGITTPFPHFVKGVAVSGTLAYIAAGGAGLRVVDVSDPTDPTEVGAWDSRGYAEGVAVAGSTVYLADGPYGLRVVDISNPARPTEVGFAYPMNYAFEVAVAGHYTYIAAAGAGLLVADVSDPAHPVEMGSLDTPGYAYGVAASGSTVYVADGWEGLQVVNVVDPAHPTQVGSYKTPGWAFGVAVSDTLAYVADSFKGLRVVDVSDPAHPGELGGYEVSGGHAGSVAVAGSVAYVADRNWGLRAVSVSDPSNPTEAGFYAPLGFADAVAVDGDYAYVAAATYGLRVVDISDPAHPVQIGVYDTEAYATSVAVEGKYAYVAASSPGSPGNGLYVVDISDPAHPTKVGFYAGFGANRDMAVAAGTVYLANEWGLELVSVSDPHSPTPIGFIDLLEQWGYDETVGVAVSGTLAYVASSFAGLEIVNVSNPISPTLIGAYNSGSSFSQDVAVVGNRAYIADYDGLRVVDVSNPANPTGMGFYDTPGEAYGVVVSGSIAYVADGGMGLSAVDVSDPFSLTLVGAFNTLGFPHEATVVGSRVYVADGPNGLLILETATGAAANGPGTWLTGGRVIGSSQESPYQTAPSQWRSMNLLSFQRPVPLDLQKPLAPPAAAEVSEQVVGATEEREERSEPFRGEVGFVRRPGDAAADLVYGPVTQPAVSMSEIASTCVVTSPADSGAGTLRWCLENAVNATMITFDPSIFPPTRPVTITLASELPAITQGNITIDGSNARVVLDGSRLSGHSRGLNLMSDGNVIEGLQILRFPGDGVQVYGAKHNVIGGDRTQGRGPVGQGNVISGNGGHGINICSSGAVSNTVVGNLIGTDTTGMSVLGNQGHGIFLVDGASNNRIGGTDPGERNTVSGNGGSGVSILGARTTGNIVVGNYVGTDISGTVDLGNKGDGIAIECGAFNNLVWRNLSSGNVEAGVLVSDWGGRYNVVVGNLIGTDASGTKAIGNDRCGVCAGFMGASFNRIGGTQPEERNLISGNAAGVDVYGPGAVGNLVLGNLIGTDITGRQSLGNVWEGVRLGQDSRTLVGGATAQERNIISGNGRNGVTLDSDYNFVAGNYIGTDASGTAFIGNGGFGMGIGAEHNVVQSNLIAYNTLVGVRVDLYPYNTIRRNSIHSHAGKGIDLTNGANGDIAAPVIFTTTLGAVNIVGTACPDCTVEVFENGDTDGEGETYVGDSTADGSGAFTVTVSSLSKPYLTATATDAVSGTSEFSAVFATLPNLSTSTKSVDKSTVSAGDGLTYTITLTNTGTADTTANVTDTLPANVTWADQFSASTGTPIWDGGHNRLLWSGPVDVGIPVTITYQVTVNVGVPGGTLITNTATVDDRAGNVSETRPVTVAVASEAPGIAVYLPIITKNYH